MRQRRKCECCVSPCDEAVSGGGDPAGRDEGAAAEEALALQKDSGEPRLRLNGCEGAAHDFVGPPLGRLATSQLCEDAKQWLTVNGSSEEKKRKKKFLTQWKAYLCPPHGVSLTPSDLSNDNKQGH